MVYFFRINVVTYLLLLFAKVQISLAASNFPNSSTDFSIPLPTRSSQVYKAMVATQDGSCFFKNTSEVLIEAQAGVGTSDSHHTGRCPNGWVVVEAYTHIKVRERSYGGGPEYRWVLRAISSKVGVLCCPVKYEWTSPP